MWVSHQLLGSQTHFSFTTLSFGLPKHRNLQRTLARSLERDSWKWVAKMLILFDSYLPSAHAPPQLLLWKEPARKYCWFMVLWRPCTTYFFHSVIYIQQVPFLRNVLLLRNQRNHIEKGSRKDEGKREVKKERCSWGKKKREVIDYDLKIKDKKSFSFSWVKARHRNEGDLSYPPLLFLTLSNHFQEHVEHGQMIKQLEKWQLKWLECLTGTREVCQIFPAYWVS